MLPIDTCPSPLEQPYIQPRLEPEVPVPERHLIDVDDGCERRQPNGSGSTVFEPEDTQTPVIENQSHQSPLTPLQVASEAVVNSRVRDPISDTDFAQPDSSVDVDSRGSRVTDSLEGPTDDVELELAIAILETCVRSTSPLDESHVGMLEQLGESLWTRFQTRGDLSDIHQAIAMQQDAVRLTPSDHPDYIPRLNNLTIFLRIRFDHVGDISDLDRAIALHQDALKLTSSDHPDYASRLNDVGVFYRIRFDLLLDPHDINQAITMQEEAVRLTEGHPDRPACISNLAASLSARFQHSGDLADLDQAIIKQEDAVRLTQADDPIYTVRLHELAASCHTRFGLLGNLVDLDRAIKTQEDALRLTPDDHYDRPARLQNLGSSFRTRFERLGDIGDLHQALARHEDAVQFSHGDHPHRALCLFSFGTCLRARFEHLGNLCDLNRAIMMQENAVLLMENDHPSFATCLSSLGTSFRTRFDHLGNAGDLDQSIARIERAVELTTDGHSQAEHAGHLNNLGNSNLTRFNRFSRLHDLDLGIVRLERAVELTPDNHPDHVVYLNNLGTALRTRFDRLGNLADLNQAIARQEQAVRLTPEDHSHLAIRLNDLAASLESRFQRFGDLGDLDQAISRQLNAIQHTSPNDVGRAAYLNNLGIFFQARFNRLEDIGDLDQAISSHKAASPLLSDDHPLQPAFLANLGICYMTRFQQHGDTHDLDQAIARQEDAVRLAPDDHPDRILFLNNLGDFLRVRFFHRGDLPDINRAIVHQEDALRLTPNVHSNHPTLLSNLALSLQARFDHSGDLQDLERAITIHEESLHLIPDGHSFRTVSLTRLGKSLSKQFIKSGDPSALERALFNFLCAARSPAGTASDRFEALQLWILCADTLQHDSLLDAHAVAVNLLPQLAWIGLPIRARYQKLLQAADMARDAAALALELGHPKIAVEWLESGRSVVWNEVLKLRNPVDELRAQNPELADRLWQVSSRLERASARENQPGNMANIPRTSLEEQAQEYRALALEREKLIAEARSLPGFERFLLGKTFAELTASAHSGPVVILNAGKSRCDALIVLANAANVLHVPLPDMTIRQAENLQKALSRLLPGGRYVSDASDALQTTHDRASILDNDLCSLLSADLPEPGDVDRSGTAAPLPGRDSNELFQRILSILWMNVVHPVLNALESLTPDPGELFRIFWCPTGPFTFLPVHAAGLYNTTEAGSKLSDFAISSYTPTLSALTPTPNLNATNHIRLLAVSQPDSDGQSRLPGTHEEVKRIKTVLRNQPPAPALASSAHVSLIESNGTVDDTLQKMKDSEWVHFACHGAQDLANPVDSALFLADRRRLKLSDIIQLGLSRPHGGMAFLSACQTATGDRHLSEEAVHLASGMLLAGYSSVIATMWSISDRDAPDVAKHVYEQLLKEGEIPNSNQSARALHNAVQRLRERSDVSFLSWVPFIHIGL